mmetsp:Transcript_111336/g.278768  ORF Transcript_111336/g.278768 Transcript_111336/m.278768 type:complete len:212 (+) Transcript_111336:438-1073(+)
MSSATLSMDTFKAMAIRMVCFICSGPAWILAAACWHSEMTLSICTSGIPGNCFMNSSREIMRLIELNFSSMTPVETQRDLFLKTVIMEETVSLMLSLLPVSLRCSEYTSKMMARTMLSMSKAKKSMKDQIHITVVQKCSSAKAGQSYSVSVRILKQKPIAAAMLENSSNRLPKMKQPLIAYAANVGIKITMKCKMSSMQASKVFTTTPKRG